MDAGKKTQGAIGQKEKESSDREDKTEREEWNNRIAASIQEQRSGWEDRDSDRESDGAAGKDAREKGKTE